MAGFDVGADLFEGLDVHTLADEGGSLEAVGHFIAEDRLAQSAGFAMAEVSAGKNAPQQRDRLVRTALGVAAIEEKSDVLGQVGPQCRAIALESGCLGIVPVGVGGEASADRHGRKKRSELSV